MVATPAGGSEGTGIENHDECSRYDVQCIWD